MVTRAWFWFRYRLQRGVQFLPRAFLTHSDRTYLPTHSLRHILSLRPHNLTTVAGPGSRRGGGGGGARLPPSVDAWVLLCTVEWRWDRCLTCVFMFYTDFRPN